MAVDLESGRWNGVAMRQPNHMVWAKEVVG